MKKFFTLFWINLSVNAYLFWEYCRVIVKYYRCLPFFQADFSLLLKYLFTNPFRLSKKFLEKKGEEDVYTYGETPLTTLDLIANQCGISSEDTVFELGCGRGRTCFWFNLVKGCQVTGIDYVPEFIDNANQVKEKYDLKRLDFRLDDFLLTDLKGASVIYLYGTCLPDQAIIQLIKRFKELPPNTAIITVSYALREYVPGAPFKLVKSFPAKFTWGTARVFLQRRCE